MQPQQGACDRIESEVSRMEGLVRAALGDAAAGRPAGSRVQALSRLHDQVGVRTLSVMAASSHCAAERRRAAGGLHRAYLLAQLAAEADALAAQLERLGHAGAFRTALRAAVLQLDGGSPSAFNAARRNLLNLLLRARSAQCAAPDQWAERLSAVQRLDRIAGLAAEAAACQPSVAPAAPMSHVA